MAAAAPETSSQITPASPDESAAPTEAVIPEPAETGVEVPAELRQKFERARGELRGDRREVVVLFADVSGFTSMSEAMDPEELSLLMQGVLNELAGVVYRFEGYVDKFIGDAVMALFGAPLAHENDPERAVLAALEMLEVAQRHTGMGQPLTLHIGLHLGEVVAAHMGSEMRLQYTVMGDTVNVASRLQGAAESNEVLVSRAVYERIAARFETTEIEPLTLKGKSKPFRAYRVIRYAPLHAAASRPASPFVGRETEIGMILEVFALTVAGEGPGMVVEAEAGAGKSRLVQEAFRRSGMDFAEAIVQFSQIDLPGRLPPSALIFRQLLTPGDAMESADPDEVASRALRLLGDRGAEHEVGLRQLARRLGSQVEAEEATSDPEIARQNQQAALGAVLEVLSMSQPIVLVLDDIHWANEAERETIQFLLRVLAGKRVGAILTSRPGGGDGWIPEDTPQLRLAGLSTADVQAMMGDLFFRLQPHIQRQLLRQSQGNPLFLEELARVIRGSPDPATAVTSIPGSLQGLIRARIDRLEEASRALLEMASVLGERFPPVLLAGMYRIEPQAMPFEEAMARLVDSAFVDGSPGSEHYVFHHSLVQEVAYSGLLMNVRRVLHESAARLGEEYYADEIEAKAAFFAHHYWEADLHEPAAPYLWISGRAAAANYELQAAERLFDRLAQVVTDHPDVLADVEDRAGLGMTYGSVLLQRGRLDEADAWLQRLEALGEETGRAEWIGQALQQRGWVALHRGELDRADERFTTGLERLGESEDALRANLHNSLGVVHYHRGNGVRALGHYTIALQLREQLEDLYGMAKSHSNIGILQIEIEDDLAAAEKSLRRALAYAREAGDRITTCNVLINLGGLATERGSIRRALVRFAQAQRLAEEIGRPFIRFLSLRNQASCLLQLGWIERALLCLDLCSEQGGEVLDPSNRAGIRLLYFEAYLSALQNERAEAMLEEARTMTREFHVDDMEVSLLLSEGRLRAAQGEWPVAAELFSRATQVSAEFQSPANLRLGTAHEHRARSRAGEVEGTLVWPRETGERKPLAALLAYLRADAEAGNDPSLVVAEDLAVVGDLVARLGDIALERAVFERQAEVWAALGEDDRREAALRRAVDAMHTLEERLPEDLREAFTTHPRNTALRDALVRTSADAPPETPARRPGSPRSSALRR